MECNDATDDGRPSKASFERYERLVGGGWGVVVVEAASVTDGCLARRRQLRINEQTAGDFAKLAQRLREVAPFTVLLLQLTHSGVVADPAFSEVVEVAGPLDKVVNPKDLSKVHVLTTEEVKALTRVFADAAEVAYDCGFDGVDVKSCHGYLGAEFLRPRNTRDDEYGGSFENRTRFFREIVTMVRRRVPDPRFVLGTRVSFYEGIPGGFGTSGPDEVVEDLSEPLQFVRSCAELGLDFVNVTAGIPSLVPQLTRPSPKYLVPAYHHFRYAAAAKALKLPLVVVGSAYSALRRDFPKVAGKNVAEGLVDFVGLGRQSLADPHFPAHLRAGDFGKIRWCVGDGACAALLGAQREVGCAVYERRHAKEFRDLRRHSGTTRAH
ncbi:MAG: NADH:flavin oxidoreductase [Promethearchaeota archaeon]